VYENITKDKRKNKIKKEEEIHIILEFKQITTENHAI